MKGRSWAGNACWRDPWKTLGWLERTYAKYRMAASRQPQPLRVLLLCLALAAISYAIHHHAGWELYLFISWPPAYNAGNFRFADLPCCRNGCLIKG